MCKSYTWPSFIVAVILMAEDNGPDRLLQLKAMFDLSKKYSDDEFVMLPGEEANAQIGWSLVLLVPQARLFL